MNRKISLALATILTLFIYSCSKPVKNESGPDLSGSWQWVNTMGGIANQVNETPASTGKNVQLTITADNQYTILTNGVVTSQGTISFTVQNCIRHHTGKRVIVFSDPSVQQLMIESLDPVSLRLTDNAYDGVISLYSR